MQNFVKNCNFLKAQNHINIYRNNDMEISFCSLRCKDVINACDGKNLGNINDIIFDSCTGRLMGIVVPINKSFFGLFKNNNDLFIPYNRICKIGKDIILVDIIMHNNCNATNCNSLSYHDKQNQFGENYSKFNNINFNN